ncbi:MAG: ATP-dependent DNA helicase [Acidobacteriota bacterium]
MSGKKSRLHSNSLEEIFSPGGILDSRLPGYEFRPSQLSMAQAVADAIHYRNHLCVEAGTGTGKTLAYLIPALFTDKRVIISTATKNLQEQIFFHDVPFIRRYLAPDLKVVYMKGRSNYLCLKKLADQSAQGLLFQGAQAERELLREWADMRRTGDRAELDLIGDDDPRWRHLDARSDTCVGSKCPYFDDCFITRMRQQALEADLIVVNHALFFANLALQSDEIGQILPDFGTVILDEAHEVEDIAASHFGHQLSSYQVEELGRDMQNVFADSVRHVRNTQRAVECGLALFAACPRVEGRHSLNFFRHPGLGLLDLRERLQEPYRDFRQALEGIYHGLQADKGRPEESDSLLRRIEQMSTALEAIFAVDDPSQVYWFEQRGRGTFLRLTPIRVAPLLREYLFQKTGSVILTSATLSIDSRFEFVKDRLGVPDPAELLVSGEFNFSQQAILYVPSSFPEPRSEHYAGRTLQEMEQILKITDGSAFLLFTSFAQMNRFYDELSQRLPYRFFRQGERPKTRLLEEFRKTPRAVLCATASFWQGVDVRGDALRAVLIDKLPFQVPTEPVVAARIHHLKEEGLDPFYSYSVPEAVITLKQGLGRLIRSRQDRGILAVFDARLRTRRYGRIFLESLPKCRLTDSMKDLENFYRRIPS